MKTQNIGIGNNQKNKIETKEMKIAKNIFAYNNSFIPLSSISRVGVVKESEQEYSVKAIAAVVIGVILFFGGGFITVIGSFIAAAGGWVLYKTHKSNQETGEFLVIELNSGNRLYFYQKNHAFLLEIMEVMTNCINNNSDKIYTISMDTYNIESCQFGSENCIITQINGEEA